MKWIRAVLGLICLMSLAGCGGHRLTEAKVPPAPGIPKTEPAPPEPAQQKAETSPAPTTPIPIERAGPASAEVVAPLPSSEKSIYTETGLASWYGPPYHNRRSANGEVYDMNQMTAAHRTLPLNSIVRVTNVKTGASAVVRITDRGPFIGERMLDLSLAAAKAVDVWEPGTAWVKMDVLATPAPIDRGGKWEVQIGAFDTTEAADQIKEQIVSRYHPARVIEFTGPTGEWVRVRVQNDDRALAEEISQNLSTPEGGVFLVRLD
jgi:rare lipoprotein A